MDSPAPGRCGCGFDLRRLPVSAPAPDAPNVRIGGPVVFHTATMSRSTLVAPAELGAGAVVIDSVVLGVKVTNAILLGVRVSGTGTISGRILVRPLPANNPDDPSPAQIPDSVTVGRNCTAIGVEISGIGQIKGRVHIAPVECTDDDS